MYMGSNLAFNTFSAWQTSSRLESEFIGSQMFVKGNVHFIRRLIASPKETKAQTIGMKPRHMEGRALNGCYSPPSLPQLLLQIPENDVEGRNMVSTSQTEVICHLTLIQHMLILA